MKSLSLQFKLYVHLSLLITLAILLPIATSLHINTSSWKTQKINRAKKTLDFITQSQINNPIKLKNLESTEVFDDFILINFSNPTHPKTDFPNFTESQIGTSIQQNNHFYLSAWIKPDTAIILHINLNNFPYEKAYQLTLLYCLLTSLLILIMTYFSLRNNLFNPINALIQSTKKASELNFTPTALKANSAEINELIMHFNEMLENLQNAKEQNEHQIHELNKQKNELQKAIEEKNTAIQQTIQAQKMATIGSLSSSIAHDLGNPTASITALSEILQEPAISDQQRMELAAEIHSAAQKSQHFIKNLLNFARQESPNLAPTSLNLPITQAIELFKTNRNYTNIPINIPENLPSLLIDQSAITQILLNLFINAAQAQTNTPNPQINLSFTNDPIPTLYIEDNGPGIPEENIHKIFLPFFTTKPSNKGTGIGLSTCEKLALQSNATLTLYSPRNKTCFAISFHKQQR